MPDCDRFCVFKTNSNLPGFQWRKRLAKPGSVYRRHFHQEHCTGSNPATRINAAGFMVTIYDAEYVAEEGEEKEQGKMPFLKSLRSLFGVLS